jgi:ankyrin repeat protein
MDILAPIGIKNLRQIKKFLAQKSLDLSEMYQATYSRIRSSDTTTADLARRVILWICYAQRPLHEVEVQHAIATELEDEDFDPDGITPGDLLRSSCMGLVICDGEGMYSLFHLTAYEFFRSNSDMNSDASQLLISRTCLTYLSFSGTGRQGACEDLATLATRKSEFRLLDYAAKHSANHIRQVEAALLEEVSSFLHDDMLRQALMQAFYHRHRDDEDLRRITFETLPSGFSPLQVACGRGLLLTAQRMLQEREDPKAPDAQGWTPLISATSYGQLDLINLLLSHAKSHATIISKPATSVLDIIFQNEDSNDRKDDIMGLNQPDNDGWTPLFWAIIKDQYQAAEQLLTAGSNINVRDKARWTPIDWAAFRGNRDFVDLILRFTPSDGDGLKGPPRYRRKPYHPDAFSPLFMAAAAGDHQSMEAMLKFGFNIPTDTEQNLKNMFKVLGKIPPSLRHYMRGYSSTSAPSLIRCDDFTVNLLEWAIRLDQEIIVKMLVELGVPLGVMKSEIKQRTPLHVAAVCGRHQICEYLLIEGASPSLPDANGFTAMDLAIMVGHPQCTRLFLTLSPPPSALMERGVSLTAFVFGLEDAGSGTLKSSTPACGEKNWCDLQMANRRMPMADFLTPNLASDVQQAGTTEDSFGFEDVVDILQGLFDNGCDPGTINQYWDENKWALQQQTALHHACSILNQHLISFLVVNGADVNTRDATGESPLYKACSHNAPCSEEIVRTLLQHGADPNALDNHGHSILCNACEYASTEVVQCLVTHGAVVKAHGDSNCHPLHFACKRDAHRPIIAADTVKIIDYIVSFSDSEILSAEDRPGESPPSTPLYLAIRANNWEAVVHLRTLGAKITDPSCLSPYLWEHAADARGVPFRLLLDLGAPISGKCALYGSGQGDKPIVAHYFDKCLHYNVLLDSGRFEATLDNGFEENLKALLEAGADINARSCYFASSTTSDVTVLRAARDEGLDDSSMQILLRHGAVEDEEFEGE